VRVARRSQLLPLALLLVVAACGGGGGDDGGTGPGPGPGPGPVTQDFDLTLSASTLAVEQGSSASVVAAIGRTGGFAGTVNLTAEGVPAGLTVTATPAAVPSGTPSSSIAVAAGATLAPGSYSFTVRAQASGRTDRTSAVSVTVTARPAASIALTATPNAIAVQAGGAGVPVTIGITRTNFTGSVVIAAQSGLPTGVTVSNNPTGPSTGTTVVVTFTAAASVTPGSYPVVLQGAGFQATPGTVTIALTVTSAPTSGSIALSSSPGAIALLRGQSNALTLTIARSNYAGSVTLAASGAPTDVTLTLTPSSTTGTTSQLGITVGANAPTGTHSIVVTASGSGVSTAQLAIPLTISAPASGGNVSWQFCGQTTIPVWVAAQDGDANAPWRQLTAGPGNSYSFDIATRGAVARVSQFGTGQYALSITYGSRAELNAQGTSQCANQTTNRPVSGTVVGFQAASDVVSVALGSAFASPPPTQATPNFSIPTAPTGLRDLIATRAALDVSNTINPLTVNRVFIRRGLNPPFNGSVGTVDFTGADAFDPELRTVTVNGITTGELVTSSNTFMTSTQSFGSLGATTLTSGNSHTMRIVPAARTASGDVQMIATNAVTFSGAITSQIRSVTNVFRDPANLSITLGAAVNTPTISTLATTPYARVRAQAQRQSDYQDFWSTNLTQNAPGQQRTVSITMTAGYVGGASTIDMAVPDFAGVSGWQNTWGPLAGVSAFWNVSMTGWVTANNGVVDGAVFRTGQRQGQFTP